ERLAHMGGQLGGIDRRADDRPAGRKIREAMIAFWLEAWLTKDEILSRYLSNVYFGDNVYGITAASKHYFGRTPDKLNIGQAAMLAGLVKAPSRLAP
ncbi:transglycosylase domain-containing protein, partial [Rhizobium brockwellii]|uniref:transglycosylase domain-containing protein n=1 Tax=Rhizobium brockwellii TaxID=3019932 RepID=UPI003F982B82